MIHAFIYVGLYIFLMLWGYHISFAELSDKHRKELHENFGWRALPAYILTIFSTYFLSYGVRWDIFLIIEDIMGHTAGRIFVEICYFAFCFFLGLYAVWFAVEYIKSDNDISFGKFLRKVRAEENQTEDIN